jgi:alanine racemase
MPKVSSDDAAERLVTPMVSASIDTGALRHNLNIVRRFAPKSRVMAVIKANAYGHGLVPVARALKGADALAVARVEEGLALRAAGIETAIVLLEGVFDGDQLSAAASANFELVIHSAEQIELLKSAPADAQFKVWLKFDSGMNRLGFKGPSFGSARAALRELPSVQSPINLMTHLASADAPELATTSVQLADFAAITRGFDGERSVANSAGTVKFPEAHTDWVRPGLLLYGVSPFEESIGADFGLKPVMTLRSHVIAVKDVAVGEHVGYGGHWVATRQTRLAIVGVGYGDGYPRSVPSGVPVLINGERGHLVGRVSMDMIAVDVTESKATVALGNPVILWGLGLSVEEISVWAQTIPYELLCGISQRVAVSLCV